MKLRRSQLEELEKGNAGKRSLSRYAFHKVNDETNIRIVIIDDHQMFREGLDSLLAGEERFEIVGQGSNGAEGIELVACELPDVVVVDINMPGMSGFEFSVILRQRGLKAKIILLTSSTDPSDAEKALELSVDGYILKEDAFGELTECILSAVGGKQFISPSISSALLNRQRAAIHQTKPLSPKEREVLALIGKGLIDKEIAAQLGVSINTARTHRARIREKLNLHTTGELVKFAIENGYR